MNQVWHPFGILVQKFGDLRSQNNKVSQVTIRQQPWVHTINKGIIIKTKNLITVLINNFKTQLVLP